MAASKIWVIVDRQGDKVAPLSLELLTTMTPAMELVPDQTIEYNPNALFRGIRAFSVAPGSSSAVPG